jgi:hypothetical protein
MLRGSETSGDRSRFPGGRIILLVMTAANPPAHRGPRDWEGAIRALTTPLPGSVPYENRRPIRVLGRYEGYELVEFLVSRCPFYNAEKWR